MHVVQKTNDPAMIVSYCKLCYIILFNTYRSNWNITNSRTDEALDHHWFFNTPIKYICIHTSRTLLSILATVNYANF